MPATTERERRLVKLLKEALPYVVAAEKLLVQLGKKRRVWLSEHIEQELKGGSSDE